MIISTETMLLQRINHLIIFSNLFCRKLILESPARLICLYTNRIVVCFIRKVMYRFNVVDYLVVYRGSNSMLITVNRMRTELRQYTNICHSINETWKVIDVKILWNQTSATDIEQNRKSTVKDNTLTKLLLRYLQKESFWPFTSPLPH